MASQSTLCFSSQDEPGYIAGPPPVAPVEIVWKGRNWARIDHAPNRKKGSKVSRIWELGDEYIALNDPNLHFLALSIMLRQQLNWLSPECVGF